MEARATVDVKARRDFLIAVQTSLVFALKQGLGK